jgi:hypothetical protein
MSSLCLLTLALAAPLRSSRVQTPPSAPQPEFVNDHVRVRRVVHAPHRPVALHEVPPALIVYVTAAHERETYGNGSSKEVRFKPGEYEWWPGGRLGGENLDDVPSEILVIVPTGKSPEIKSRSAI